MRITPALVRVTCRRLGADSSAIPTKDDDRILCSAVQQGIEADLAMRTMLEHHRGLMHREIRRYIPEQFAEEAVTEAMIGMTKAIRRFDPSMGWRFSTYATHWIRSRIRRMSLEQSGMTRVPEYSVYRYRRMRRYMDAYHRDKGDWPDDLTIAKFLGVDVAEVRELHSIGRFETCYLQDLANTDAGEAIIKAIDPGPEETVLNILEVVEIADAIKRQTPERQQLWILRYGLDGRDPMSFREIAREIGCSSANVEQKMRVAIKLLKAELAGVSKSDI